MLVGATGRKLAVAFFFRGIHTDGLGVGKDGRGEIFEGLEGPKHAMAFPPWRLGRALPAAG